MYDFFASVIGHNWDYNAPASQGYIFTGCVVLVVILAVYFLRLFCSWLSYVLNIYRH